VTPHCEAGRFDADVSTSNTINDLLMKAENPSIERAEPFENPVINGESILGYGAFGFHQEDVALREAFNEVLAEFIGSPEHLKLVERFGFDETTLPGEVTAAELIEGSR
jgi:polar amino acid transport system substrate-binding protein